MTPVVVAAPPAWGALEEAMRRRRPVVLTYHGRRRCLSPHALGWKDGTAMLLAYQSAAETTTAAHADDPRRRWRNFFVDEVHDAEIAGPAATWESADNYHPSGPFNAIDDLVVAVGASTPSAG